jgi:hypothetical protein
MSATAVQCAGSGGYDGSAMGSGGTVGRLRLGMGRAVGLGAVVTGEKVVDGRAALGVATPLPQPTTMSATTIATNRGPRLPVTS